MQQRKGKDDMNQTVLITGSSRGIGAACAARFAAAGYAVMVHYHTGRAAAEALCREIGAEGGRAACFGADIADPLQAAALVEATEKTFGAIDVLVNNAGIALYKMFCDTTPADWNRVFSVNINGMAYVTQAVLPSMVHNKAGKIVNLSSIWGITGGSCEVAYSASKAAVIGFTKALAKELGPSGIFVNCVAPGVVETDMNANLDDEARAALLEETPLEKIASPAEIAETVFYLASPQNSFITGQVISPNGGLVI